MNKSSSPIFTGQGGANFEFSVCALYFAYMLTDDSPNCLPGRVLQINLQTGYSGDTIEDIVVETDEFDIGKRNYFQIKSNLKFAETDNNFKKVMKQAWKQFHNQNFKQGNDRILLGLGIIGSELQKDFNAICEWARASSNSEAFLTKITSPRYSSKNKMKYLELVKDLLRLSKGSAITDYELWNFLRSFFICHFEVKEGEKDWNYCINRLSDKVISMDGSKDNKALASLLMSHLFRLAGDYASKGGSVTKEMLIDNSKGLFRLNPIKSAALHYSDVVKVINNQVFKKLQNLQVVRDTLSSIAMKVDDEYYDRISYISHAENILKNYANIFSDLIKIKQLVKEYNRIGSTIVNELMSFLSEQMLKNFPNLSASKDYNLNVKNSYSISEFLELLYEYSENGENSEIVTASNNFFSIDNDNIGYALERIIRGAGVNVSWRIVTSTKETDTNPEIIFNILKLIDTNREIKGMFNQLKTINSDLTIDIQKFSTKLKNFSESIDLNLPYHSL